MIYDIHIGYDTLYRILYLIRVIGVLFPIRENKALSLVGLKHWSHKPAIVGSNPTVPILYINYILYTPCMYK